MTDESTQAFPLEPRTSPIPLRKQRPIGDRDAHPGQPVAPSAVVVPSNPAPYPGFGAPQQGYPSQGYPSQNPQQGYPSQGYPSQNPQQGYPGPQYQQPSYQQGYPAYGPGGYPPNQYPQPVGYAQQPAYSPGYASTAVITHPAPNGGLVAVAWVVAVFTGFYMLPWAVAATRGKSNQAAIGLLNLFLGWTFIGWVAALIMSCTSEPQPIVMVQQNHYGNGYHR